MVVAHLIAQAARARMDEERDGSGAEAESGGDSFVEHLRHVAHFHEVVAAADGAEL
jgi:hypothetical protein